MKVNVRDLLKKGIGESERAEFGLAPSREDDLEFGPGQLQATFTRIEDGLLADLDGERRVALTCDRCLEEFEQPLRLRTREIFRPQPQSEEEWPISAEGELDLTEPVRQGFILELPIHPLCRPDCPGLENPASGTMRASVRITKRKA